MEATEYITDDNVIHSIFIIFKVSDSVGISFHILIVHVVLDMLEELMFLLTAFCRAHWYSFHSLFFYEKHMSAHMYIHTHLY